MVFLFRPPPEACMSFLRDRIPADFDPFENNQNFFHITLNAKLVESATIGRSQPHARSI
jgi:hypothetical protein